MSVVPPTTTTRLVCGWSCRAASKVPLQSISTHTPVTSGGSTKSTPVFFSTAVKTIGTPGKRSSRCASRNRSARLVPETIRSSLTPAYLSRKSSSSFSSYLASRAPSRSRNSV